MEVAQSAATARHAPPPPADELNKITMNIRGEQVAISGLFDLKGLRLLEKKIAGLKAIMTTDEDEDLIG